MGVNVLNGNDPTDAVSTVTISENKLHLGAYFNMDYYQEVFSASGVILWGIETNDKIMAIKPTHVNAPESKQVMIEFYEAPAFTGGAEQAIQNRNFMSTYQTQAKMWIGVTVTDDGTLKRRFRLMGVVSLGNRRIGGALAPEAPYILKPHTKYLVKVTNEDTVSTRITLGSEFYERRRGC